MFIHRHIRPQNRTKDFCRFVIGEKVFKLILMLTGTLIILFFELSRDSVLLLSSGQAMLKYVKRRGV